MERKKVLLIYPNMMIGGSSTSLLSILNEMDYESYDVDLVFFDKSGELIDSVPKEVNILKPVFEYKNKKIFKLRKLVSAKSITSSIKAKSLINRYKSNYIGSQLRDRDLVRYCRRLNKKYDIAISFLELWPLYYCLEKVNATKKISWIHVDYKNVGFLPALDYKYFSRMDKIVLVSEKCLHNFDDLFPSLRNKTCYIDNILSSTIIRRYSDEQNIEIQISEKIINFATVCRIVFSVKGLDRGVRAFSRLKKDGLLESFHWYIIGDGPDFMKLEEMIKDYGLNSYITLLGAQNNPFPYIKNCDVFFLPSLNEGKPMAVTEAQMLGLVPIVTKYSSASEQINDGIDGIILENNEEAIYQGLKEILRNHTVLKKMKNTIIKNDYSNINEIKKIYDLFEE